jgi:pimeloyl-ACP methyl ester carboxylesterase
MFQALQTRGLAVQAVEQFGHDPRYPVTSNWTHLVQQLLDYARPLVDQTGEPLFFVGHSLGGFLSLMAAAKAPEMARGVLLLDAPILGGWRANLVGVAKRTQLVGAISPGKVSRKRRNQWPDAAAALAHFQSKRAFAQWHPQVLADYITHGTVDKLIDGETRRVLRFDRDVETAIYNTAQQPGRFAAPASGALPGGVHWRHPFGRDETSGHGPDPACDPWPHHDAGRQPFVPNGATAGHSSGH